MPTVPYQHHYGLNEPPFSIAPNPRFLYVSASHREALAHLLYGLGTQGGGIVLLTGPAGTGKTLVCRALLDAVGDDVDVAVIDEAAPDVEALLASVCRAFGVDAPPQASVQQLVDRLNAFLQANHARGRSSVLLVDGAHGLSVDTLEQLRLLTNLETNERKLLQVLLVGRPELQTMVARHDLRQLAQRIVVRCHLQPLAASEIADYVHHRWTRAGGSAKLLTPRCGQVLHALSQGVPRTINLLCDRALLGAALRKQVRLEAVDLTRAAQELGLPAAQPLAWRQPSFVIAAVAMVMICAVATVVAGRESYGPTDHVVAPLLPQRPLDVPDTTTPTPDAPHESAVAVAGAVDAFAWPEGPSDRRNVTSAFAGLLQRWGVASAGKSTCADGLPSGLQCVRARGGLAELKALDLPVVLHFADDRGQRIDGLLSQIGDDALLVEVNGSPQRLSITSLRDRWRGEYTLVWRAPLGADGALLPGGHGPAVTWLRERLAQWRGQPVVSLAAPVDTELQREVRAFQIAEGLEPDGIAGMKTFARLNARTNVATPTLAASVAPLEQVTVMP